MPVKLSQLQVTIRARLYAAGVKPDDPGLAAIRAWNAAAFDRGAIRVELRRGQFGQTRVISTHDQP